MMNSKMMKSGGMAKKTLPMVKKDGAVGTHKMPDGKMMKDSSMAKMKPKMAAGGGMMRAKMGMSGGASKGGIGEEVTVRGSGAARSSKARIY